jgi:hypothetical protein|nr:MAG TPA: holin [Bacteriophage sp.]
MELVNKVLGDKQLFISTIVLFIGIVALYVYVLRIKGREAVLTLIRKAEYLFDLKGQGKEKLQYVIDNARTFVPAPYKWFISVELINKLVAMLQPEFKEDKKIKGE